jgi:hypothetical protein
MRSCISAFFAVIDCKKTWKSNHDTNRKKINYNTNCNNLRGLRAHEHWTLNLLLVANAETIPLHFTLEFEEPRKSEWMINLQGVSHAGMQWIMSPSLPDFLSIPTQRHGSNTKPGDKDTTKSHKTWNIASFCVEGPDYICHYTKLEYQWAQFSTSISMVQPLDVFQGPSQCQCLVALSILYSLPIQEYPNRAQW